MERTLPRIRATTILAVRRDGKVALGGDGQVTVGETIMKSNAQKVRALRGGQLLAGFAGSAADAFTLFEKFEEKLDRYPNNLSKAAVELGKDWRSDRVLRRLEALLAVVDRERGFIISGNGDIIEPEDGILAIGSGGPYAQSAARALLRNTDMAPADIERLNPNYVGGDIAAGVADVMQVVARPTWSQYSTPVRGLYLCSASTPPGVGVHGMCGYHAAHRALRELW